MKSRPFAPDIRTCLPVLFHIDLSAACCTPLR